MRIFHVYLNGKKVSTAGVGELGVLSAYVTWVRRKREGTRAKKPALAAEELCLGVSGLVTGRDEEHVRWLERNLKVDDEVRIVIADGGSVDQPRSRERCDPVKELQAKKRYVRAMAKELGWKIQRGK
jgi:hypothetical protein